jgi:hypothetical protein
MILWSRKVSTLSIQNIMLRSDVSRTAKESIFIRLISVYSQVTSTIHN